MNNLDDERCNIKCIQMSDFFCSRNNATSKQDEKMKNASKHLEEEFVFNTIRSFCHRLPGRETGSGG